MTDPVVVAAATTAAHDTLVKAVTVPVAVPALVAVQRMEEGGG